MQETTLVNLWLPIANLLIMLGVGLVLQVDDFRRIGQAPRPVLVGVAGHYLWLPLLGFAVAWLHRQTPDIAVGIVLVAACPSASVSNLLSLLARGNVALAVTLTAISAIATLVSVPLLVGLAAHWFGASQAVPALPIGPTIARLAVLVLLPLAVGMTVRRLWPVAAAHLQPWAKRLGLAAMLFVVIAYVVVHFDLFARSIARLGPSMALMSTAALLGAIALARAFRVAPEDVRTIGMEVGVQNCGLAALVALTLMRSPEVALPAITYGVVMFLPALALVSWGRRHAIVH